MNGVAASAVHWVAGSPLWRDATDTVLEGTDADAMRRPALLRFGSDTFMDDLAGILQSDPERVREHVATPVSHRVPPVGAPEGWEPDVEDLKLFHPFHGDFNLVAASLVCRMPGMPDHTVRPGQDESVAFVMRRVERAENGHTTEFAWIDQGLEDGRPTRAWIPVAVDAEHDLADGEQLFPMFPLNFRREKHPRRLFVGLVPVSSGETFKSASRLEPFPPRPGAEASPSARAEDDPRWVEFDRLVVGPLVDLTDVNRSRALTGSDLVDASRFLLVDFADFLVRHLPSFWSALRSGIPPAGAPALGLFQMLLGQVAPNQSTWRAALVAAWDQRMAIAGESDQEPTLAVSIKGSTLKARPREGDALLGDSLQERVRALLTVEAASAVPQAGTESQHGVTPPDEPVPKLDSTGQARYRIRCIYRRPQCAPFSTDLVSVATKDFTISALFDPDAPARQIRIPLPVDTSIKSLRQFRRNVGFVISNQLRGQMNRITDLKNALDGDLGESEEWDFGMLCQFSIPIITICALIVLVIFLYLLNIVFFWLPFFRICLPIPVRSRK